MPWVFVTMKEVLDCLKPREAVKKRYTRGFPNGETWSVAIRDHHSLKVLPQGETIGVWRQLSELKQHSN
jgi:hypothetical protein